MSNNVRLVQYRYDAAEWADRVGIAKGLSNTPELAKIVPNWLASLQRRSLLSPRDMALGRRVQSALIRRSLATDDPRDRLHANAAECLYDRMQREASASEGPRHYYYRLREIGRYSYVKGFVYQDRREETWLLRAWRRPEVVALPSATD